MDALSKILAALRATDSDVRDAVLAAAQEAAHAFDSVEAVALVAAIEWWSMEEYG